MLAGLPAGACPLGACRGAGIVRVGGALICGGRGATLLLRQLLDVGTQVIRRGRNVRYRHCQSPGDLADSGHDNVRH